MINIENLQSAKFMSKEAISKVAPSVFTMNPSNEVSDKYTHIPTEEVIADTEFEDLKMRHMGYTFEELQGMIKDMVEKLPLTVESMNKMKEVELEEKTIVELAKDLLDIRVKDTNNSYKNEAIDEVLTTQRKEDEGNGLWEVFNTIQENIINGNFHYNTEGGKERQARIIKNFKQDLDLNRKMFAKALEYAC